MKERQDLDEQDSSDPEPLDRPEPFSGVLKIFSGRGAGVRVAAAEWCADRAAERECVDVLLLVPPSWPPRRGGISFGQIVPGLKPLYREIGCPGDAEAFFLSEAFQRWDAVVGFPQREGDEIVKLSARIADLKLCPVAMVVELGGGEGPAWAVPPPECGNAEIEMVAVRDNYGGEMAKELKALDERFAPLVLSEASDKSAMRDSPSWGSRGRDPRGWIAAACIVIAAAGVGFFPFLMSWLLGRAQ